MALVNSKTVTITAESKVGDVVVSRLSASVNSATDVNSAYSEQILNTELYSANKVEARKDMEDFRKMVYKLEDELTAEVDPV